MKFIIATNNPKKLKELERILNPFGIEAVSAKDAGVKLDEVEETGKTFAENAFLKADAAFKLTGMPSIADDSGLSVDALDGRPGVYSARYAGENATDEDRINKLLFEMKNVPKEKRNAHFTSSICCIISEKKKIAVEGICYGTIAFEPAGDGNFGYDPVFVYDNNKTFAQMTTEEKDKVSHRGNALRMLKTELKRYLEDN
ncbi:MAG: XTP/dITP diphosphatase [Oscillospiraceae bacterium]|nr:XTP/dITP diphosphatase [Oscillospiraceae bacterium]